jgi:hypothetical protein
LASRYPQIRVSRLTHARALAVKLIHGTPMDFQMDKAFHEWLERNHPEIISSVADAAAPTPPEKKDVSKPARKPRKK